MQLTKRDRYADLLVWKNQKNKKPLIIRGARQVGKTTLIKQFSKEYDYFIHLNLEKSKDASLFKQNLEASELIDILFLRNNINSKNIDNTLLFIDEIQEEPRAIAQLRYFYEDYPGLSIIGAGSLLEHKMKDISNFPVGRVEFLYLFPFNFREFLIANNKKILASAILDKDWKASVHELALEWFNRYAIIGGMPEVVTNYAVTNQLSSLPRIYESIWTTYKEDILKYAKNTSQNRIIQFLVDTAPLYADQRIKFQNFGNSNYKSREVSEAFKQLNDAKIIQLIYPCTKVDFPIIPSLRKSPRLQFLDTGILNFCLSIQDQLIQLNDLSDAYRGAIIPHLITQELISKNTNAYQLPHFWVRDKKQSSAEVDLLIRINELLIPIEIKSGKKGTLKSLHEFIDLSEHPYAVRLYAGKYSVEEGKTKRGKIYKLLNLPYYLGLKLEEEITNFIKNNPF